MAIVYAKKKQRQLKFLSQFFFILNSILTSSLGLRIAVGGSLDYTQFLLFMFPSTIGGFLMGTLMEYLILGVLTPLAIFYSREIEDIKDPYETCRAFCKAAEEYHNRQVMMEMKNLNSIVEDVATELQLPVDKVPLLSEIEFPFRSVEQKFSLLERFKLKELLRSQKTHQRVQHFSKFIK